MQKFNAMTTTRATIQSVKPGLDLVHFRNGKKYHCQWIGPIRFIYFEYPLPNRHHHTQKQLDEIQEAMREAVHHLEFLNREVELRGIPVQGHSHIRDQIVPNGSGDIHIYQYVQVGVIMSDYHYLTRPS